MNLDQVILKMYASMCFEAGAEPDWQGQTDVFSARARLVRVNDDGVFEFDPESFRADLQEKIASGTLTSFWETELWRETHEYADFAHVLSAYEMRHVKEGDPFCRAIKSIQLFRKDERWWISAMLWRREGVDVQVSAARSEPREL